jgi:Transposase DDE domain group 1
VRRTASITFLGFLVTPSSTGSWSLPPTTSECDAWKDSLLCCEAYAETRYAAKSWARERRTVARIEASASQEDDMLRRGLDIRYVTSLNKGGAEYIYATLYRARGQAENLIKQHKAQTASDRTSRRSPLANQFRLILHTAAYWLLLDLRDCAPSWNPVRQSEFATLRLRLLKIAGRFTETASRIRVSLASCCPEAELFSLAAFELQKSGP